MNQHTIVGTIRQILIPIFVLVLVCGAGGSYLLLRHNAMERASDEARLVLDTALAIRSYTELTIVPSLAAAPQDKFYEATVPAFAAQSVYRSLQQANPAYTYRKPALNPTSPNDRPTPLDVELINGFRANPGVGEVTGIRDSSAGTVFYLARRAAFRRK